MALITGRLALAAALASTTAHAISWGTGWNLGNTLEAPGQEGSWAPPAQDYFFDDVKAAGFTAVRIPVRWDERTLYAPPYTVNATFLARVKQVVDWSIARNFTTIINSHDDSWLDNSTTFDAKLPRFLAIWTQVAATFAGYPPLLAFEVFNEPHVMSVDNLNAINAGVLSILRSTPGLHPTRTVFLGGLQYMGFQWLLSNPDALVLPKLPDGSEDPYLAVELHNYDPFHFTTPPISVPSWGTPADITLMQGLVSNISSWASYRRPAGTPPLPLLLGEFATSHLQNNTQARLLWYKTFSTAVEGAMAAQAAASASAASTSTAGGGNFIGWTIWDDDGWFQTYNRGARTWDSAVLQALGMA